MLDRDISRWVTDGPVWFHMLTRWIWSEMKGKVESRSCSDVHRSCRLRCLCGMQLFIHLPPAHKQQLMKTKAVVDHHLWSELHRLLFWIRPRSLGTLVLYITRSSHNRPGRPLKPVHMYLYMLSKTELFIVQRHDHVVGLCVDCICCLRPPPYPSSFPPVRSTYAESCFSLAFFSALKQSSLQVWLQYLHRTHRCW